MSLVVVLVRTQDLVNIAGVVRAMKNFELRDLRLVAPEEYEARRIEGIAHKSGDILKRVRMFDDLDQAITAVNDSDYGLVASVFTRERTRYERCIGRIRTGLLNWNKGTIGASGRLPFGGSGKSGNDRPAGITATVYCSVPQAHLESDAGFDPASLPPGMPKPS